MSWWKRIREGITTSTRDKKDTPDGVWHKCTDCKKTLTVKEISENQYVCPYCNYHERISAGQYFEILFNTRYKELFTHLRSRDFLEFKDLKSYDDRLFEAHEKTGLNDAIRVAQGRLYEHRIVIAAMDFRFIGGSMGSVVGEKISLAVDHCLDKKVPLLIISKSGGARMMESSFSLMQMAKTAAKLSQLAKAKIPFISLMTDPTTGGVTASFAMLGDVNIAEPNALIGFAGPRVIKETIKKNLPDGFQKSEFLMEHGFLDFIVHRKDLKTKLSDLLLLLSK